MTSSAEEQGPNYLAFTLSLSMLSIDALTALGVIDGTSRSEQVRQAVSTYLEQPDVADRRLQLRLASIGNHIEEPMRRTQLYIRSDYLERLNELATTYKVPIGDHVRAALNGYRLIRLADPDLPKKIDMYREVMGLRPLTDRGPGTA